MLRKTFSDILRCFLSWRTLFIVVSIVFFINILINLRVKVQAKPIYRSLPLILLYTHNYSSKTRDNICRGIRNGNHVVNFNACPKKCEFSCRFEDFYQRSPLAVLFFGEDFSWSFKLTDKNRLSWQQRWIFWSWEAPIHHKEYTKSHLTFNWTMTYRQDSDIVHSYGKSIFRNLSHTIRDHQSVDYYLSTKDNSSTFDIKKEFSSRKNEILWIVSNCQARTKRNEIAKELQTLFPIDQYGQCAQSKRINDTKQLLLNYKFYLAFENAHCQDYITEKVFYNSFAHGSIPIVLGPDIKNYEKILPPKSFIAIDQFKNLQQLADHLKSISQNLALFSSYHQWRRDYRLLTWPSNYFIDDRFCDLCIKLHNDMIPKTYTNFSQWLNRCK